MVEIVDHLLFSIRLGLHFGKSLVFSAKQLMVHILHKLCCNKNVHYDNAITNCNAPQEPYDAAHGGLWLSSAQTLVPVPIGKETTDNNITETFQQVQ